MDGRALENIDAVIHLAGAGVADKRWSSARKQEILESRTASSALLFSALAKGNHAVKTFVSASAIGYYGFTRNQEWKTEQDLPGTDFLSGVVVAWENGVDKMTSLGLRVVNIRIGIVLSKQGGALAELARPVRFFLGAALGTGRQEMSWIHIDDLCNIFIKAIEDQAMSGVYNGVSPVPATNDEMTRTIAQVLRRPLWLPRIPGFFLRLLIGEMADVVLNGNRVSADKIMKAGFKYRFVDLKEALRDLL